MERKLLLLGMLHMDNMHGYQINEFIDSHLGSNVQIKKPTAYHLLNKMTEDGWITFEEEQEGNRPARRVYSITSAGEAAFQKMLRQSLADYKPAQFHSDIALIFLDRLPTDEAVTLLQERRTIVENCLDPIGLHGDKHEGGMQFLIEHQRRHLSAELEWIDEVIERVKTS